jgi:hypothetical protein
LIGKTKRYSLTGSKVEMLDGSDWVVIHPNRDGHTKVCMSQDVADLEVVCQGMISLSVSMVSIVDLCEEKGLECLVCENRDTGYCDYCRNLDGDASMADEYVRPHGYYDAKRLL